jgi:nitrite reductase/ring-hydroxylating ferredoxin subunit
MGPIVEFVNRLVLVLLVMGVGLGIAADVYLWPDPDAGELVVGTVDELEPNEVTYIVDPGLYVVSTDQGLIALWDDARHIGERVLYCARDETFSSPLHGEKFDRLGRYIAGPAAGDMGIYPLTVRDDDVLVDVSDDPVLPDRSEVNSGFASSSHCVGQEDPAGFYADGLP